MAVSNSITKSNKKMGITTYLTNDAVKNQINNIIGGKNGTKFITAIVSAVNSNPALQECTNQSILSAALLGQSLNLSPSPQLGMYYLVPYNDKEKGKVAQFQLGYKGYIQLAIRSGQYKKLNVLAIKEGELVKFDALNEEIEVNLITDEEARERAATIGYYAMFEYINGFRKAMYWSKAKMLQHADRYSQSFSLNATTIKTKYGESNKVSYEDYLAGKYSEKDAWMYSSFWYKDFDGMAYKTMLRQLISKWGIMSTELEKAYEADQGVIGENGSVTYVDNDDTVIEAPVAKEEPIMPPPVEKKPEGGAPESPEEAAAIAGALFK